MKPDGTDLTGQPLTTTCESQAPTAAGQSLTALGENRESAQGASPAQDVGPGESQSPNLISEGLRTGQPIGPSSDEDFLRLFCPFPEGMPFAFRNQMVRQLKAELAEHGLESHTPGATSQSQSLTATAPVQSVKGKGKGKDQEKGKMKRLFYDSDSDSLP